MFLPQEQLDRKTYLAVNKCLVNIGGKWDRKAKGHVFDHDPSDDLDSMLLTGETVDMKKVYQFFPTPTAVAEQMCGMAELDANCVVLEPSCGRGDLADVIYAAGVANLLGVELNPECLVAEDIFWHETEYRSNFNVKPIELHHTAGPQA